MADREEPRVFVNGEQVAGRKPTFGDAVLLLAQLVARNESGDPFVNRADIERARDHVDAAVKRDIRKHALGGEHQ